MEDSTQFACYVRNMTAGAISLSVPLGALEREPQMSARAHDALLAANRARVSTTYLPSPAGEKVTPPPTAPAEPVTTVNGSAKPKAPENKPPEQARQTDASPEW